MARDLAREFKCHGREWLKCLRGVEAKKFLAHVPSTMSPLSGTEFLPFSAQEAFDRQKFNSGIKYTVETASYTTYTTSFGILL